MITIETNFPVASDSLDHTHPHGTGWDNSIWPPFNAKLFALTNTPRLLDLGCAGGGLVRSIIEDGGFAVGVEGSDFSQKIGRAEWSTIPGNLFTADCTKPFQLYEDGDPSQFDIVTSWEVLEHIPEDGIAEFFQNVKRHMANDGILAVSICTISAGLTAEGIEHHVTIRPEEWWMDVLVNHGFTKDDELTAYFDPDWVRGPINGVTGSLCMVLRLAN